MSYETSLPALHYDRSSGGDICHFWGAGFKSFQALNDTAEALGSAGNEILLLSSEVASVNDKALKTSRTDILNQAISFVPGLPKQCGMIFCSREKILNKIKPVENSKLRFVYNIRWMREPIAASASKVCWSAR